MWPLSDGCKFHSESSNNYKELIAEKLKIPKEHSRLSQYFIADCAFKLLKQFVKLDMWRGQSAGEIIIG